MTIRPSPSIPLQPTQSRLQPRRNLKRTSTPCPGLHLEPVGLDSVEDECRGDNRRIPMVRWSDVLVRGRQATRSASIQRCLSPVPLSFTEIPASILVITMRQCMGGKSHKETGGVEEVVTRARNWVIGCHHSPSPDFQEIKSPKNIHDPPKTILGMLPIRLHLDINRSMSIPGIWKGTC